METDPHHHWVADTDEWLTIVPEQDKNWRKYFYAKRHLHHYTSLQYIDGYVYVGDKVGVMPDPYFGPRGFPRKDDCFPTRVPPNVLINANNESSV